MMHALGKAGFDQSYTYFTWRNARWEIEQYVEELAHETVEYFRPNFFVNTPDILHAYLQDGGRPAFEARLVLAATLSPSYGIYSGFENLENTPLHEGSEEYLGSEKYELKKRRLDGELLPLVKRLNEIRRAHRAFQHLDNVHFLQTENELLIAYAKTTDTDVLVVVVNLDPDAPREGLAIVPDELAAPRDVHRPRPARRRGLRLGGRAQLRPAPAGKAHVMQVLAERLEPEPEEEEEEAAVTVAEEVERVVRREHTGPAPRAGCASGERRRGRPRLPPERRAVAGAARRPRAGRARAPAPAGVFEGHVPKASVPLRYRLEVAYPGGARRYELDDPYAFLPTLGELDLHLAHEGRHEELYEKLGAHVREVEGVLGTAFAVWAPTRARSASSATSTTGTGGSTRCARSARPGSGSCSSRRRPASPRARTTSSRCGGRTAGRSSAPTRSRSRPRCRRRQRPSCTRRATSGATPTGSRSAAPRRRSDGRCRSTSCTSARGARASATASSREHLGGYVRDLGFTHVELLPVMEHPFGGSWGYQVTSFFAPTSRFGGAGRLRFFVDAMHQQGIGVILDWVPAYFPRDERALARFDGTALYEHADPRAACTGLGHARLQLGRNEVRNFRSRARPDWPEETTPTGSASTRSRRCSTSTTAAAGRAGSRTSTADARTSSRSRSCAS